MCPEPKMPTRAGHGRHNLSSLPVPSPGCRSTNQCSPASSEGHHTAPCSCDQVAPERTGPSDMQRMMARCPHEAGGGLSSTSRRTVRWSTIPTPGANTDRLTDTISYCECYRVTSGFTGWVTLQSAYLKEAIVPTCPSSSQRCWSVPPWASSTLALFCLRVLFAVSMGFPCQASDCGRCFSGCLGQHRHTAHVHHAQNVHGV